MAENEVLDVARGRRWHPLRALLAERELRIDEILDEVGAKYARGVLGAIRQSPLAEFLRAGSSSPEALRAAVQSCTNAELGRLARMAIKTTNSLEPFAIAREVARLYRDSLLDRIDAQALNNSAYYQGGSGERLRAAVAGSLDAAESRIVEALVASLQGSKVPVFRHRRVSLGMGVSPPVSAANISLIDRHQQIAHGTKRH